jgi:hypothetical protein
MIVRGIEYLDEEAELFPDGSVHDATLARDSLIGGLPCAGNHSVVFYPSGSLKLAWLSSPVVIGGIPCASGVVLYLHENGQPLNVSLSADHRFGPLSLPSGTRVTLDDDGQLLEYSHHLEFDQTVAGLPCSAAFNVWRYPSGRPSLVVLAFLCVIDGKEYPRGTEIAFAESGEVLGRREVDLDSGRRYMQRVFGVLESDYQ